MGGFKNKSNNADVRQNIFSKIVLYISKCCKTMREDCRETGEPLYNHENRISARLVERYLDMNYLKLRFILEKPTHYNAATDTHAGRTDITVVSSDWFKNRDAYYTIESKRLDGKPNLNREYVSEGISRFITPFPPKYPSYYGKNIMLGYVVQTIDISENARRIDKFQRELLVEVRIGGMRLVCDDGEGFSHYQCMYEANNNLNVELAHLFYDFSDVMRSEQ